MLTVYFLKIAVGVNVYRKFYKTVQKNYQETNAFEKLFENIFLNLKFNEIIFIHNNNLSEV